MPDTRLLCGQVAFLLAVILMLLVNTSIATPIAILLSLIGVVLVTTAESSYNDWLQP